MTSNFTCPTLKCIGVTKSFYDGGTYARVLDGADFEASRGQLNFILGPSGCGKSTLLSIIAGLLSADDGRVEVLGTILGELSDSQLGAFRMRNIGIVLQQFQLLPALTVVENIALPLIVAGTSTLKATAAARDAAGRVGLEGQLKKYPRELSVGQKQRTAIARATIHQPGLLLCDEPTAALDHEATVNVMTLLRSYAVELSSTVVVVTHDHDLIDREDNTWSISQGGLWPCNRAAALETRL